MLRPFAAGGTGSLYVAVHKGHDRRFILKLIRPRDIGSADSTRLLRELQRQAALRLPFSTLAVETGATDGLVWLLRDFVAGRSFASQIRKRGGVSLSEALAVIGQAATALDELHRAGLLHRAVEPRHMLLSGTPVPELRLIDVGIAETLPSEGALEIVGSAGYVAPEVLAGKPASFRSDLYGLGCVFYEALAGTLPPSLGPDEPLPGILERDVPPPVWSLLTSILAHDPRRRPFSAQHVRRALEPFLPPGMPSARRAGSEPSARQPSVATRSSVPPAPPPAALRPSSSAPNPRAAAASGTDATQELSSRDLRPESADSAVGQGAAEERSRELALHDAARVDASPGSGLRATRPGSGPLRGMAPDRTQELSLSEVSEADSALGWDLPPGPARAGLPPKGAVKPARVPDPTQELSLSDIEAALTLADEPVSARGAPATGKPDAAAAGQRPRSSAPPVPPAAARSAVRSSSAAPASRRNAPPSVEAASTLGAATDARPRIEARAGLPPPSDERAKLRSRDSTAPFVVVAPGGSHGSHGSQVGPAIEAAGAPPTDPGSASTPRSGEKQPSSIARDGSMEERGIDLSWTSRGLGPHPALNEATVATLAGATSASEASRARDLRTASPAGAAETPDAVAVPASHTLDVQLSRGVTEASVSTAPVSSSGTLAAAFSPEPARESPERAAASNASGAGVSRESPPRAAASSVADSGVAREARQRAAASSEADSAVALSAVDADDALSAADSDVVREARQRAAASSAADADVAREALQRAFASSVADSDVALGAFSLDVAGEAQQHPAASSTSSSDVAGEGEHRSVAGVAGAAALPLSPEVASVPQGLAAGEASSVPLSAPSEAAAGGIVAAASSLNQAAPGSPRGEAAPGSPLDGAALDSSPQGAAEPSGLGAARTAPGRFDVESLFDDALEPEPSPLAAAGSGDAVAPEAALPVVRRSVRDRPVVGIRRSRQASPRVWPMLTGAAILGLVAISLSLRTCGSSDDAPRHVLKPAPGSPQAAAPVAVVPPPSAAEEREPQLAAATEPSAPVPTPPPAGDVASHDDEATDPREQADAPSDDGRTLTAAQARPARVERGSVIAYQGGPADGVDHKAKARELYSSGNYREAAEAYERATQRAPSDAGAYAGLGASYLAANQPERAITAYQRALQLSPKISGFQAALGRAYLQKGDRGRAAAAYRKALDLDPKNAAARAGLAAVSH